MTSCLKTTEHRFHGDANEAYNRPLMKAIAAPFYRLASYRFEDLG